MEYVHIVVTLILGFIIGLAWSMRDALIEQRKVNKKIIEQLERIKPRPTAMPGRVTPPFEVANRPKTVSTTSRRVVTRKSPDQIRNENYNQIVEQGKEYGSH